MALSKRAKYMLLAACAPVSVTCVTLLIVWVVKRAKQGKATNDMKTISQDGINLIKRWEGYRDKAYRYENGTWTIGYGHTKGVKEGDTCTKAEAEQYLRDDLEWAQRAVNNQGLTIRQCQFDALVSFVYNVGTSNFQSSTLLKKAKVNADDPSIKDEFPKWNKAYGKVMQGLTNRRETESKMYFSF